MLILHSIVPLLFVSIRSCTIETLRIFLMALLELFVAQTFQTTKKATIVTLSIRTKIVS